MRRGWLWTKGLLIGNLLLLCAVALSVVLTCSSSRAQEALHVHPTGRTDELSIPFTEEKPPIPGLMPEGAVPAAVPKGADRLSPGLRVFLRGVTVTGSTVFSEKDFAKLSDPYLNREVTAEDIEALRRALTLLYINKGYVNSGAILPDQTVADGVIRFQVVEGELTDIEIEGNKWLRTRYYRNRLALGAGPPLNVYDLQQRLQLLQQDDRVQQIHAELKPGLKPGESELKVRVDEPLPFALTSGFNNYQSPSVGAEKWFVSLVDKSLTLHGDTLGFSYAESEGMDQEISATYTFPITSRDTTLSLHYQKNEFHVVEEPFRSLRVRSESDVYGIAFRQPLYRSLNQEFAVALAGERLSNQSFLLDEPFSFALGEEDGRSVVTALRLSQEWVYRTQSQVFAARSRLSLGIDALGSTINSGTDVPDSHFFAWLGQFQWAKIMGSWGIQSILRTDIQLSNDPLLPLEQIPVGGRFSVRGYRENTFVRDNAVMASFETRIPVVRNQPWADYLQLAPFVDFGKAWNTSLPTPPRDILLSAGIGLRWSLTAIKHPIPLKPEFEIYWGYPIEQVTDTDGHDLQDHGIHMQLTVAAF